ncbi:AAA family ATPase [Alkalihalobacillus sp. BA299]|uniref:AAA family ATPase n=1 Tax=Alkalihalobacillus sp. BA299 TaxID=2815938 RepID=UPI001ADA287B|nr:AAA family ATPase [Alkalihalobacillus sp. BA299]
MTVLDVINPDIQSYYVKAPVKFKKVTSAGVSSGGATLYLSQTPSEWETFDNFFNNFDPSNVYRLTKQGLIEYLLSVKFEYILHIAPPVNRIYSGDVSLDYWKQKYEELVNLTETEINNRIGIRRHMASNPDRLYIGTSGSGFDFLRSVAIPDISVMQIEKVDNGDGTFIYNFKPVLKENFDINRDSEVDDSLAIPDDQVGKNLILYGAPGTGKSRDLDKRYANGNSLRVTFHPEYTYHDFVGSYRPEPLYKKVNTYTFVTVENETFDKGEPYINYSFVPGPFTLILEKVYRSLQDVEPQMFTLIIEELNRANAPAVFGDLFQLLDRESDGESTYGVTNLEILKYLKSKGVIDSAQTELRIPWNLNIVATMNSADQGVFVMDSAFKRRWIFEYSPIKPEDAIHKNEAVFYDDKSVRWADFINTINDLLANHSVNEDRHIGPYFLKPGEPSQKKIISSKLLMYLWDDVARLKRSKIFVEGIKTFSHLVDLYEGGKPVFQIDFKYIQTSIESQLDEEEEASNISEDEANE